MALVRKADSERVDAVAAMEKAGASLATLKALLVESLTLPGNERLSYEFRVRLARAFDVPPVLP
jgi:hypothetical protein